VQSIFKEFLPDQFEESVKIMQPQETNPLFPYTATEDIFGDGSILLSSHDGHTKGQGCLFLPEYQLFIGADLCWGIDLLPLTEQMRWIPSQVQDNVEAYLENVNFLRSLLNQGIDVLVSHDPMDRVERILDEKMDLS